MTEPTNDLGGAAGGPANPPEPSPCIWARATINLPWGLHRDQVAWVCPDDPVTDTETVADFLRELWLVPLPGQEII